MKFSIISILFISLSLVSCGWGEDKMGRKPKGAEISGPITLTQVDVNIDSDISKLILSFSGGRERNIKLVCRGADGCLRVCEHLGHPGCKKFSVDEVVSLWLDIMGDYDWEQAKKDLKLIATEPNVSNFLKNVDQDNRVVWTLFSLNKSASCPIAVQDMLYFQHNPYPSLYLSFASAIEAQSMAPAEEMAEEPAVAGEEMATEEGATTDSVDSMEVASVSGAVDESAPAEEVVESAVESAPAEEGATADSADSMEVASVSGAVDESAPAEEMAEEEVESAVETVATEEEAIDSMEATAQSGPPASGRDSKKIIDSAIVPFNLSVFAGFVKQCFGFNTRTFSEMAVQIENHEAFEMGHQVIIKACGRDKECVRLAYCAINSELVWDQLPVDLTARGCAYNSFAEMAP